MEFVHRIKPIDWPANGREESLQAVDDARNAFDKNPDYKTKERLVSLLNLFDINQFSSLGICRVTQYEVALINELFWWARQRQLPSLRCFLYTIIGKTTQLQITNARVSELLETEENFRIPEYEEGLDIPLKLYYCVYQDYIMNSEGITFAEQIIKTVKHEVEDIYKRDFSAKSQNNAIFEISYGFIIMLDDISYFYGNKTDDIWKFKRKELLDLFSYEAELIRESSQQANQRPLRSVLIGTIANFVLKSRNEYNGDYICKYISVGAAEKSAINHEIWMKRIDKLNDENEGHVIKELFDDRSWISVDWIGELDFNRSRQYYVSSFSKTYNNEDMKRDYGSIVYGYKNDRIAELISPLLLLPDKQKIPGWHSEAKVETRFSQVICFDVLYDEDKIKDELSFLFTIIEIFFTDNKDKNTFLNIILQYWILSVKEIKWSLEQERRYVIFLYDCYKYIDTRIEDIFLKTETNLFLYPDFMLGMHKGKNAIGNNINKRRKATAKPYLYCSDCFNCDYDMLFNQNQITKCPICCEKNIKIVKALY